MKLDCLSELDLFPTTPFNFDSTFHKPDHFPTTDTRWQNNQRWQTMLWQGERLGLIFENDGTTTEPKVTVRVHSARALSPDFLESLQRELTWRYNLNLNLEAFYQAMECEPVLRDAVRRFYCLRPMHPGSLYEYLIIAIVLQNATVRRSVQMMQALFERYGTPLEFDGQTFWCFWTPDVLAQADEQELRAIKMGYRAKSLIRVSIPFANAELDEMDLRTRPADEQEAALLALYGIGPASVGYILFDVFHRWDVLKHISPWEQKIYTRLFFDRDYETDLVPVSDMLRYFERWGQWKNLAIHYLWQDLWWKRRNEVIPWLEQLIRL